MDFTESIIPRTLMSSKSMAYEAEGRRPNGRAIESEPIRALGIIVKEPFHSRTLLLFKFSIQLFRERLSEKMGTRQFRKIIWDMINTLSLTL